MTLQPKPGPVDHEGDFVDEPTSAWSLASIYAVLIIYASLYPFQNWRNQELNPLEFLMAGWPHYWSAFDVVFNIVGYAPLGFFLTLGFLRTAKTQGSLLSATAAAMMLSLFMECLQSYLPARVPSLADWVFNTIGAGMGAMSSYWLEQLGFLDRWSRFRSRWFISASKGVSASLVLIALWPFCLLFPSAVPLGLGQIQARVQGVLHEWLSNTPFLDWLPNFEVQAQPLAPGVEVVCVALGLLTPYLLGVAVIQKGWQRMVYLALVIGCAFLVTGLSTALSFGPTHAWSWMSVWVGSGLVLGLLLCLLTLRLDSSSCDVFLVIVITLQLFLINQKGVDAYLEQNLQTWEQGRFIRFHGLAQWLGWVWPFAVLALIFYKLARGLKRNNSLK
jgi:VanZ family protein